MRIGVVADDITGANDIGIMFAKSGYTAHVYPFDGTSPLQREGAEEPQVVILDTNSRCDPAPAAYEKVYSATQALERLGCERFIKKTCSVFRGNVGVEFDAMLDALGEEFAVVVLGFPKNGRTTVDGIHYVHEQRLRESPFRHDPIHPMTRSSLVEILQSQTRRKVAGVSHELISQGVDPLREHIFRSRPEYGFVIFDVLNQESLTVIAEATQDEKIYCGSSALAEELPAAWGDAPGEDHCVEVPHVSGVGILCASGSLTPQTAAQVCHMAERGTPVFELETERIIKPVGRDAEVQRLVRETVARLRLGDDVILSTAGGVEATARTKAQGPRSGLVDPEIARLVSEVMGVVVAEATRLSGQNRLLVAGGETSAAVCSRLGIKGLRVWQEIEPGLPSCVSLSEPRRLLVLKSGSFGKPDFFEKALAHLRAKQA